MVKKCSYDVRPLNFGYFLIKKKHFWQVFGLFSVGYWPKGVTLFYFESHNGKIEAAQRPASPCMVVTLETLGEKRSKCARRRRGREESERANRQPGTSAAAAEHLPDPDLPCLQLPILRVRL